MTYYSIKIFSLILSFFPRLLAIKFAIFLGTLIYFIYPKRKNVAIKNLTIAFPEKSLDDLEKIIKITYQHYMIITVDFLRQNFFNKNQIIIDQETKEILSTKHGLIFMTAHIGNWEMFIPIISQYKKMIAVVRVQANEGGDKFVRYLRSFHNITLIPNKGSKRKMLKGLLNGESLLLASDQNAKKAGTYIDFFGLPASIPRGAAHFHVKTNKKILVGFCMLNENDHYEFKLRELNYKKTSEQKDQLIIQINTEYSRILEEEIKKHPNQYFWFHKKWDKEIYNI